MIMNDELGKTRKKCRAVYFNVLLSGWTEEYNDKSQCNWSAGQDLSAGVGDDLQCILIRNEN
jgi:hypothetical protein